MITGFQGFSTRNASVHFISALYPHLASFVLVKIHFHAEVTETPSHFKDFSIQAFRALSSGTGPHQNNIHRKDAWPLLMRHVF